MPLSHLPITRFVSSDTVVIGSIKGFPFYKSLIHNDQSIFEKYRRVMCHIPNQLAWCEFLDLKEKIALKGFKNSQHAKDDIASIFASETRGQYDGHHRLAILAYLHGEDVIVQNNNGIITFI